MLHPKRITCAVLITAILSSGFLCACGEKSNPISTARAAADSAYTLSADISGTVVQKTDYSPVVANLYRNETREISYHVDGDSDTRNMHASGTVSLNGAKAQKDNVYYMTTNKGEYLSYTESTDGKSYISLESETLPVTEFRDLIDAVADGEIKANWTEDSSGQVFDETLYRCDFTLEGDQLSYLDNWSRLVAIGTLGKTTEPNVSDGTADMSIYVSPKNGKLAAVNIQGKNLFRSALNLYGQTIYTTTSKYNILVKFNDASVSKQVGQMPAEERKKGAYSLEEEAYQKARFDLVSKKNTTELDLPDIADAEWTDMRITTGKQDFELPIAYRSVAEDWLFKDASLYNGYQLKDQEYTTVDLYSIVLGNSVDFKATISNDSGKTQDISDCTVVAISLTQKGNADNGSELWLPKNISFGSAGGDIETAYGYPGDGNKVVGNGYDYTSYHYVNQDSYLDLIVNDKTGLSSFAMGFVTSGMEDASNRVDTSEASDAESDSDQKSDTDSADSADSVSSDSEDSESTVVSES